MTKTDKAYSEKTQSTQTLRLDKTQRDETNSKKRTESSIEESDGKASSKRKTESRKSKKESPKVPALEMRLDEILRIGGIMGRHGTDRRTFEWLADNRSNLNKDTKKTARMILLSIGDLPVSKELAYETIRVLVKNKKITEKEYASTFAVLKDWTHPLMTIAELSRFISVGAAYYHQKKVAS